MKLIAGVFELEKPYFNLDMNAVDRELGAQRATGIELSVSGELVNQLNVNAGLLAGQVRIMGPDLPAEGVGPIAAGQPRLQLVITADYRIPRWPALSVDTTIGYFGATPESLDNAVYNPSVTLLNVGGRYRFTVADRPATLRVMYRDVAGSYFWNMGYSPGFFQFPGRTVIGYVTADF